MDCLEVRVPYQSASDVIKVVFLGDCHIGSRNVDEELVRKVAVRLREPLVFWVDLGDPCEFINMKDRRFEVGQLADWIGVEDLADLAAVQVGRYVELFGSVADSCLCRLSGNHDDAIKRNYERDVYGEINKLMGLGAKSELFSVEGTRTPGYGAFMRMVMRRRGKVDDKSVGSDGWTLNFFLHHGAGGGKLAGAKALNLERLPMAFDADVFAVGHTHTKMVLIKRRLAMHKRKSKITEKPLVLINVGSFMRGERGGYAERGLLYPQGLGPVELWIYPQRRELRVVQ